MSNTIKDLKEWVKEDLGTRGHAENYVHIVEDEGEGHGNGEYEHRFKFRLYTFLHEYAIVAVEKPDKGYLGCQVSTRRSRAGEHWTRGNDLPDGLLTRETWDKILKAIVIYELEQLSPVGLEAPEDEVPIEGPSIENEAQDVGC
jgi:hypothetical protein